ncbi:MAG: hypothetical protein QXO70_03940 [Candidatus Pacearchaeota archaeon]
MSRKTMFFPAKNKRLADIISIHSPEAFMESIRTFQKNGIQPKERKALILAQNRAKAMLKRKNLSSMERRQFREIAKIKIPHR